MKIKFFRTLFTELTKIIKERNDKNGERFLRYETVFESLIQEYNGRFKEFEKHGITLKLALQLHILGFSEDNIIKTQFNNKEDP